MRYFLELSYDGTDYAGWQQQSNALTVQECIQKALSQILQTPSDLTGCGRTDKGVHARYFVAHCDLELLPQKANKIVYQLNRMLPSSIACTQLTPMKEDAHARYDATSRSYEYQLHGDKNPFISRFSTYEPSMPQLNRSLLDQVAAILKDTTDFTSFCKAHGGNKTNQCIIYESQWKHDPGTNRLYYNIKANRFLRGMVRLIVGSSLSVAKGKLDINQLVHHIQLGTRSPLMKSAPARGLSLVDIEYQYFKRGS